MAPAPKPASHVRVALSFGAQCVRAGVPHQRSLQAFIAAALNSGAEQLKRKLPRDIALALRVVEAVEGRALNQQYRGKDYATNVLSFPSDAVVLAQGWFGDIVVCKSVLEHEARAQGKLLRHHYAHMCVHASLHLLGFTHDHDSEATRMEALEARVLAQFGIANPYE
jgi:probable rRNA maturation factor